MSRKKSDKNPKKKSDQKSGRRKAIAPLAKKTVPRGWGYRFLVGLVWVFIGLLLIVVYYGHDLPDIATLKPSNSRAATMVMDREGTLIASYGDVYGDWLLPDVIPQNLIRAVIATEDRRFYKHGGIDGRALIRAMIRNVATARLAEGGSTITQQLAKNLFLNADKTIKRKIQELLLALWLEINFDKAEILNFYLNRVYFGSGAYGIDAAARTFFGHSARNLSLIESAMLTGILKGPALYSPLRDLERSYSRAAIVLDNMVEAGFLDQSTADRHKKQNVTLVEKQTGGDERYFSDWIVDQARRLIGPVNTPIIIYTTLMPTIQNKANKSLQQMMDKDGDSHNAGQAALVSLDKDGAIRAMVGGRDYSSSQFNRAAQAYRQPGSAFKLFVYLAALEWGLGPDDRMRDSPVILDGWQPENYTGDYRGLISLKDAFAHSVNTVAVKLAERIGRQSVVAMAQRLGLNSPMVTAPSLSLGTADVSLLEMTAAYAVIANGGRRVIPYGITEIQNSSGQILYRYQPAPPKKVLSDAVVATMDGLLQAVVNEGTARRAQLPFPVAGKTGTTQNYRDALFFGYGLDITNGVWVGNDNNDPMKRVTGGDIPARIWRHFMYQVYLDRDDAILMTPNVTPRTKPDRFLAP